MGSSLNMKGNLKFGSASAIQTGQVAREQGSPQPVACSELEVAL